jgi:hypothetical protein
MRRGEDRMRARRREARALGCALAFVVSLGAFAQPVEVRFVEWPFADVARDAPRAAERLLALAEEAYFEERPVVVRLTGVAKDDAAELDRRLPEGPVRVALALPQATVVLSGQRRAPLPSGARAWRGTIEIDGRPAPVVTRVEASWDDDSVIIDVDMPGTVLRIRTLGDGAYAMYRVDSTRLPEDVAPLRGRRGAGGLVVTDGDDDATVVRIEQDSLFLNARPPAVRVRRSAASVHEIGVAMAFTAQAARDVWNQRRPQQPYDATAARPLLADYATGQLDGVNRVLQASRVQARLALVDAWEHPIDEPPSASSFAAMKALFPPRDAPRRDCTARGDARERRGRPATGPTMRARGPATRTCSSSWVVSAARTRPRTARAGCR